MYQFLRAVFFPEGFCSILWKCNDMLIPKKNSEIRKKILLL
jgi:hypothetical protein